MKKWNTLLPTIFIDVDETLTRDCGLTFIENSLETVKLLSLTSNIFIWSAGGMDYAQSIVYSSGLQDFVCGFLPKPDFLIDDLQSTEWLKGEFLPDWKKLNEIANLLLDEKDDDVGFLDLCDIFEEEL